MKEMECKGGYLENDSLLDWQHNEWLYMFTFGFEKDNFGCIILNLFQSVHFVRGNYVDEQGVAAVKATENERTNQLIRGFLHQVVVHRAFIFF